MLSLSHQEGVNTSHGAAASAGVPEPLGGDVLQGGRSGFGCMKPTNHKMVSQLKLPMVLALSQVCPGQGMEQVITLDAAMSDVHSAGSWRTVELKL